MSKKSVKKLRETLLVIMPEITAILDDLTVINKMRNGADELSDDEAIDKGLEMFKEFIDMLLVRQYDGIIRILSAIYEIEAKKLEEKEFGEVMDMLMETLSDEAFMSFFPQLGLWGQRTRLAI